MRNVYCMTMKLNTCIISSGNVHLFYIVLGYQYLFLVLEIPNFQYLVTYISSDTHTVHVQQAKSVLSSFYRYQNLFLELDFGIGNT